MKTTLTKDQELLVEFHKAVVMSKSDGEMTAAAWKIVNRNLVYLCDLTKIQLDEKNSIEPEAEASYSIWDSPEADKLMAGFSKK